MTIVITPHFPAVVWCAGGVVRYTRQELVTVILGILNFPALECLLEEVTGNVVFCGSGNT